MSNENDFDKKYGILKLGENMKRKKHMNVNKIFEEMIDDVNYIKFKAITGNFLVKKKKKM